MTEFKVGDRVRLKEKYGSYDAGTTGKVVGVDGDLLLVDTLERRCGRVSAARFELAGPRKDTPAVGDTVRVVLEGKVSLVDSSNFGITSHGGLTGNYIVPDHGHVKSIEIITPAKPSAGDLPAWAVLTTALGEIVQRQGATDMWLVFTTPVPERVTTAQIDQWGHWTHLVPKGSE